MSCENMPCDCPGNRAVRPVAADGGRGAASAVVRRRGTRRGDRSAGTAHRRGGGGAGAGDRRGPRNVERCARRLPHRRAAGGVPCADGGQSGIRAPHDRRGHRRGRRDRRQRRARRRRDDRPVDRHRAESGRLRRAARGRRHAPERAGHRDAVLGAGRAAPRHRGPERARSRRGLRERQRRVRSHTGSTQPIRTPTRSATPSPSTGWRSCRR